MYNFRAENLPTEMKSKSVVSSNVYFLLTAMSTKGTWLETTGLFKTILGTIEKNIYYFVGVVSYIWN